MKNPELISSASAARKLTDNPYNIVNKEEEMAFSDLIITGNFSDYDILK